MVTSWISRKEKILEKGGGGRGGGVDLEKGDMNLLTNYGTKYLKKFSNNKLGSEILFFSVSSKET